MTIISAYTFYLENTVYRDNPSVSIRWHLPLHKEGFLFVLIFNIYIGQSNYLKISSLSPPMVDPTIVTYNFYLILRFLLSIYFISAYTFYLKNTVYRDNPSVSIRWHLPLHKEGFLFVLIFNIYIGQSNYLKINSLGPPMVDPTPVSLSIAIIYFVARFFRLFPLYINGLVCEFFNLHSFVFYQSFI